MNKILKTKWNGLKRLFHLRIPRCSQNSSSIRAASVFLLCFSCSICVITLIVSTVKGWVLIFLKFFSNPVRSIPEGAGTKTSAMENAESFSSSHEGICSGKRWIIQFFAWRYQQRKTLDHSVLRMKISATESAESHSGFLIEICWSRFSIQKAIKKEKLKKP